LAAINKSTKVTFDAVIAEFKKQQAATDVL
jgi:hypothetical protein